MVPTQLGNCLCPRWFLSLARSVETLGGFLLLGWFLVWARSLFLGRGFSSCIRIVHPRLRLIPCSRSDSNHPAPLRMARSRRIARYKRRHRRLWVDCLKDRPAVPPPLPWTNTIKANADLPIVPGSTTALPARPCPVGSRRAVHVRERATPGQDHSTLMRHQIRRNSPTTTAKTDHKQHNPERNPTRRQQVPDLHRMPLV